MALKAVLDTLEGVPEAVRDMYVEKDGKFTLAVEGMVPKARLDEFRDNNTALRRQVEETTALYDGIDPERARELIAKAEKARDKQLIDAGKVDELLEQRTAAMKTDFDKQVTALTGERDGMRKQLEGLVVDGSLRDAAVKAGVRPEAIPDLLNRGRSVYRLEDGKAVPMDGDKVLFGKAGEPMPITEWVDGLTAEAPHLFMSSQGSGSRQAQPGGAGVGRSISRTDTESFLANVDRIAKGELKVA